jgi:hypothetical protein
MHRIQFWMRELIKRTKDKVWSWRFKLVFIYFLGADDWCSWLGSIEIVMILIVCAHAMTNVVGSFHDIRLG